MGGVGALYVLGRVVVRRRARRAAVMRQGDSERLEKVHAVLGELWVDEPPPRVILSDAGASRVRFWARGQPAHLVVCRQAIDAGPDELRGELAHEYAHVIDPAIRGEKLLGGLAGALLAIAAPYIAYFVLGVRPNTVADYWIGLGIQCVIVMTIFQCSSALVSRPRERRTDAAAADLLGSAYPVFAMLRRIHAYHIGRPLYYRVATHLSHPDPANRISALLLEAVVALPADTSVRSRG